LIFFVMAGLDPAMSFLLRRENVDARDKPAHDGRERKSLSPVGALWTNAMVP
jgi:hypothetical protein